MVNVFLNDAAYARLKAVKREEQSFSDVVLEKIPQDIDWDDFVGAWKGIDAKKAYAEIKRERER